MSDFIFSKKNTDNGILSEKLHQIYGSDKIEILEFHSQYGSVAYSKNHYNGYEAYDTTDIFFIVIGGPILNFRDNSFLSKKGGNEGTKAIYDRWKNDNKVIWDEDLSGPFVIFYFDKKNGVVEIITDMMSFIPVYSNLQSENLLIGTHIDAIAQINNNTLDKISIADFILHEVVTFPYTIYHGIKQLTPSTIYKWNFGKNGIKLSHIVYWLPCEEYTNQNLKTLANNLNNSFIRYISNIVNSEAKIATFISGGEDSRLVLSAIPKEYPKESFIFVDNFNHETSIAEKISKKLNTKIIIKEREVNHYWKIMEPVCDLIGISGDYAHVHTYGFHKLCKLNKYDVILGGFFADALLKGYRIQKKYIPKVLRLLPITDKIETEFSFVHINAGKIFKKNIVEKVYQRRIEHLNYLKEIRSISSNEWFYLYPASMNPTSPNISGNRRLFRSYEPFTDSAIIKISTITPQPFKLNRRMFHMAFKSSYEKTKFIPHSSGYYPYLPWYFNNAILTFNKIFNKIITRNKNEGSWSDWDRLINSKEGELYYKRYFPYITSLYKDIFNKDFLSNWDNNQIVSTRQKRIMIQLGYQIKNR